VCVSFKIPAFDTRSKDSASLDLLSSLLFEVRPNDPATFFSVAALLAAVAIVAGMMPARRASRVDPLVALREG